jgi:hypothetical protein
MTSTQQKYPWPLFTLQMLHEEVDGPTRADEAALVEKLAGEERVPEHQVRVKFAEYISHHIFKPKPNDDWR